MEIKELRKKAMSLRPVLNIGKDGIKDSVVEEIKKQLKLRKLIKIKLLRSFSKEIDRDEAAAELAKKTGSRLVEVKGFTILLYKIEKNK